MQSHLCRAGRGATLWLMIFVLKSLGSWRRLAVLGALLCATGARASEQGLSQQLV